MFAWRAFSNLKIHGWLTGIKLNVVSFTVSVDFGDHVGRKRIYNRGADAVKTGRNLIATVTKLAASMEHRKNGFKSGFFGFWVDVDRNTASIIIYADATIL